MEVELSEAIPETASGSSVVDVAAVKALLAQRGVDWREALYQPNVVHALNHKVVFTDAAVSDGDELAFFPPMTGGSMSVSLQVEAIDVATEYAALIGDEPGAAVVTFTGYVRKYVSGQAVTALELEHYPEMAESVLSELGRTAAERFGPSCWRIVHRYGSLSVLENIVWVVERLPSIVARR